jgi:hypothetical protein
MAPSVRKLYYLLVLFLVLNSGTFGYTYIHTLIEGVVIMLCTVHCSRTSKSKMCSRGPSITFVCWCSLLQPCVLRKVQYCLGKLRCHTLTWLVLLYTAKLVTHACFNSSITSHVMDIRREREEMV